MTTTPRIIKMDGYVERASGSRTGPLRFILSEESDDRMGDLIRVSGWELKNFKANPVMLLQHQSGLVPIGKWADVRIEGKRLMGTAIFDEHDPVAVQIERKYRTGFMNAVSVGFRPLEMKERRGAGGGDLFRPPMEFIRQELLEASAVSVPAHPGALLQNGHKSDAERIRESARILREAVREPVTRPPSWGEATLLEAVRDFNRTCRNKFGDRRRN